MLRAAGGCIAPPAPPCGSCPRYRAAAAEAQAALAEPTPQEGGAATEGALADSARESAAEVLGETGQEPSRGCHRGCRRVG
eukprot:COSAG02_NODE_3682_length_6387_cov_7.078244_3_plen_81_part_00